MTTAEVNKIIQSIDDIAAIVGGPKIMDTVNQFQSKVPNEMRDIVLAQVKEDVAKSISEAFSKTQTEMQSAVDNPELIAKLKTMGPQEESEC